MPSSSFRRADGPESPTPQRISSAQYAHQHLISIRTLISAFTRALIRGGGGRGGEVTSAHPRVNPSVFVACTCVSHVLQLLQTDPTRRLTIDQVKQHPWVRDALASAETLAEVELASPHALPNRPLSPLPAGSSGKSIAKAGSIWTRLRAGGQRRAGVMQSPSFRPGGRTPSPQLHGGARYGGEHNYWCVAPIEVRISALLPLQLPLLLIPLRLIGLIRISCVQVRHTRRRHRGGRAWQHHGARPRATRGARRVGKDERGGCLASRWLDGRDCSVSVEVSIDRFQRRRRRSIG